MLDRKQINIKTFPAVSQLSINIFAECCQIVRNQLEYNVSKLLPGDDKPYLLQAAVSITWMRTGLAHQ